MFNLITTSFKHSLYRLFIWVPTTWFSIKYPTLTLTTLYLNLTHLRQLNYFKYKKELTSTEKKPEELTYGETLNFSLKSILDTLEITKDDVFIDLGCGKGKACFMVNKVYDISCIGIDIIPSFISIANKIKQTFDYQKVTFINDDFLSASTQQGSILLIPGTCLTTYTLQRLSQKLSINKNLRLTLTLSAPLNNAYFDTIDTKTVWCDWGTATLYIQKPKLK